MKPRKIVQVATIPESDKYHRGVYALADDGTAWSVTVFNDGEWSGWTQLPPLPPIEEPEGEEKEDLPNSILVAAKNVVRRMFGERESWDTLKAAVGHLADVIERHEGKP